MQEPIFLNGVKYIHKDSMILNKQIKKILNPYLNNYDVYPYFYENEKNCKIENVKGLKTSSISFVSENIQELKGLEFLKLSAQKSRFGAYEYDSNLIKNLPDSIGKLRNLKYLYLSHNPLTALPESLGELENLEELYLSDIKLKCLPESIGRLNNLKYIDVSNNFLETLPESIKNLKNLMVLCINNNKFTKLPGTVENLESLFRLSVAGNSLEFLPEFLGNLNNLKYLEIAGNSLEFLPEKICKKNIHYLNGVGANNFPFKEVPIDNYNNKRIAILNQNFQHELYRGIFPAKISLSEYIIELKKVTADTRGLCKTLGMQKTNVYETLKEITENKMGNDEPFNVLMPAIFSHPLKNELLAFLTYSGINMHEVLNTEISYYSAMIDRGFIPEQNMESLRDYLDNLHDFYSELFLSPEGLIF